VPLLGRKSDEGQAGGDDLSGGPDEAQGQAKNGLQEN